MKISKNCVFSASAFEMRLKKALDERLSEFFEFAKELDEFAPKARTSDDWMKFYEQWSKIKKK